MFQADEVNLLLKLALLEVSREAYPYKNYGPKNSTCQIEEGLIIAEANF